MASQSRLPLRPPDPRGPPPRATRDPAWARWLLTGVALAFLAFFLVLPIVVVFAQAFSKGGAYFLAAIREPDALSSDPP